VAISVTIRDQAGVRGDPVAMRLEGVSERTTLRDLIVTRVRDEVARYNADKSDVFRGLVQPEDTTATALGYVMPSRRTVDWERQAERAVESFRTNGFFVLVDDVQVTELDDELSLTPESDIRFIRLVQLIGG
jgi:hypothetical protein